MHDETVKFLIKPLYYVDIYKQVDGAKLEALSDKLKVVGIYGLLLEFTPRGI
jgi:hypothetical protein